MTYNERIHILIVEDENILAMELSDCLENEGYYVVGIANNGRKALDQFRHQRVDLLLCDIVIRGDWDGIETADRLMAEHPVPIIYLTALSDTQTLERAKRTHPAAFLTKPYQLVNLRTAIELAVSNFSHYYAQTTAPLPTERDGFGREIILQADDYLFIKQSGRFVKIMLRDLLYLEASDVYTTMVTTHRKFVLRLALSGVLERIKQVELVRIHRSYAVNFNQADAFSDTEITIGKQVLPIGRSYKENLLKLFT